MSATYNWAYRPGVSNKYGITINTSADDVRPSNAVYVALFGNDITGNGSRQLPYRTIAKAASTGIPTFIFGSGVWREDFSSAGTSAVGSKTYIGDGDVTMDFSYFGQFGGAGYAGSNGLTLYNVKMVGSGVSLFANSASTFPGTSTDVYYKSTIHANNSGVFGGIAAQTNCVFDNYPLNFSGGMFNNCTFYNMGNIQISSGGFTNCIFYKCNISVSSVMSTYPRYCVFYQCNFRFNTTNGTPGGTYPTTPTGFTYYSDYSTMVAACLTTFPSVLPPFPNCIIADPQFNNVAIADYTLQFSSPAKNLSYFGTYVGAYSIGQAIKVSASESTGGFEFSSAVNCSFGNNSLTLTDTSQDAQVDTKPIVNIIGREIARLPSYGFNADRNGQYIDSIADLSATTYAAGNTLPMGMPFIVEVGAITYNSSVYQAGDRGTTVAAATVFSTAASGVIREITEAPQRHTIMARFSDGGSAISAGTALSVGYYYFVVSGSVTYDTVTYNAGDIFKAVDTNAFSGSGSVIVAFSTESFQHYEPGIKPTSNNSGDNRTGAIVRGNGDPAYDRGGLGVKEFSINAKFIQVRYIIRVSNLRP